MLVSEIISRIRTDLGDQNNYSYSAVNLLDRIRTELNDTAGNGEPVDVIPAVRAILGDDSERTGSQVSLDSIRAELNDTADITEVSSSDLLGSLREFLGDDSTRTGSEVSLDSIRAELNDTANVSPAAGITAADIRAKLGDPADSVLGVTTAANVNADSVIHYAQWGNTGGVTGTTGNINGSVQLAASTNQLSSYAQEGVKVLKGMRPDALVNGQLSGGFQAALNLYVLARCLEGEVETGTNGYQVFYDRFTAAAAAVPPHVPDSAIASYITLGQNTITGRRPDLGICAATVALLEDFVMAQVAQTKLGGSEKHQVNLGNFNNELDKIPYHYSNTELNQYVADGQNAVKALRPDAGEIIGCFSDAVKSYAVCHALGRRFGKIAETMSLWQAHDANFKAVTAAVPYHWTDAELNGFLDIISNDISGHRPDLGFSQAVLSCVLNYAAALARFQIPGNSGNVAEAQQVFFNELDKIPYHYTDTELNQYISDGQEAVKALRPDGESIIDCFSEAVKSYAVCHALGRRFGKAAETMSLWQAHDANFKAVTAAVPYHWTDEELASFNQNAESLIDERRPDLNGTAAASIDAMHYTVFSAIERRIGKDENAAALHKVHYDQFYADMENLPYHWTDAQLTGFQNEAIQLISSLRDDLVSGGNLRSDIAPAAVFCISSLANNRLKDPGSRNLSDAQWNKLVNLVKSLPYHWTDTELLNLLHDSIRDILRSRSDARLDDFGFELAGIEAEPLITDEFPLRESFAKASEFYSAAAAVAARIGQDSGAENKYQLWQTRYQNGIKGTH